MSDYNAEIAVNRFGMGARSGELKAAQENTVKWLLKQIRPIVFDSAVGDLQQASAMLKKYNKIRKNEKLADEKLMAPKVIEYSSMEKNKNEEKVSSDIKSYRKSSSDMIMAMEMEVLRNAITTSNSLSARLLDFFSNHFSVSSQGIAMRLYAPLLEREAIAPNLSGHFVDMLLAVEKHPAMLTYLNNERSIGPDSPQGKKSNRGLNENLGREILELHTLGVDGGYTQKDVRELAMAITGWSLVGPKDEGFGFMFRERTHQPGMS
jgi:uncharacterized protein (DUF1800 family)